MLLLVYIYNLVYRYRKDNRDLIYRNRRKQEQENRDTQERFDREISDAEIRRDERRLAQIREKQKIKEDKERRLDELISGEIWNQLSYSSSLQLV